MMKPLKMIVPFACAMAMLWQTAAAQNTEGTIEFEEVIKLKIELPPEMQAMADQFPTEQKTKMVLHFNAAESLYEESDQAKAVAPQNQVNTDGVDVEVNAVVLGGGASTITYFNRDEKRGVRAEDMMGKKFLVQLEGSTLEWKVLNDQRKILGYSCIKAQTMRDSLLVTAWFTLEIPASVGPDNFRGLPGAILALEIPRPQGATTIAATSVKLEPLKKTIEKPKKGQRVSEPEFREIVDRQMEEMRIMHGGERGGGVFIQIDTDTD